MKAAAENFSFQLLLQICVRDCPVVATFKPYCVSIAAKVSAGAIVLCSAACYAAQRRSVIHIIVSLYETKACDLSNKSS